MISALHYHGYTSTDKMTDIIIDQHIKLVLVGRMRGKDQTKSIPDYIAIPIPYIYGVFFRGVSHASLLSP